VIKDDGTRVWVWTTFSADQVDFDYAEPEVLLAMTEVLLKYLERGASILRLDAVAFAWKQWGTNCLDRPEVHTLVRYFRALIDEAAPGAKLLSETNLPPAINDSYFGNGDEASFVYQFALPPLALHAFVTGRSDWLTGWARSLPRPTEGRCMVNFLSSHDGIGVTPARGILPPAELDRLVAAVRDRGGLVSERATPDGPVPYELNITFFDAITESVASSEQRIQAFLSCHAIMLALAGLPALWFHSLVGSHNWTPGPAITASNRSIHRERLDADSLARELDDPDSERYRVFHGMLNLLSSRSSRKALEPTAPQSIVEAGQKLFALVRGDRNQAVLAVVNVSDYAGVCRLPAGFHPTSAPFDPTLPSARPRSAPNLGPIGVPAWGTRWVDGTFEGVS
jgi:sucrose phosphorylase